MAPRSQRLSAASLSRRRTSEIFGGQRIPQLEHPPHLDEGRGADLLVESSLIGILVIPQVRA